VSDAGVAALQLVESLEGDGWGRALGGEPGGRRWATAETGLLHLWSGRSLERSVPVPGYVDGAPAVDADGTVRLGRFVVAEGSEPEYVRGDQDILVGGLDGAAADFPERLAARRVEWLADGSAAAVLATYRKPRERAGTVPEPPPPPDRLLLVDGRWERLLAVLDEGGDLAGPPDVAVAGGLVAVAGSRARAVDARSGRTVAALAPGSAWEAVAWAAGGQRLALAGDGEVALCGADGSLLGRWELESSGAGRPRTALDANATRFAVASGATVDLWSAGGALLARTRVGADVQGMAFSEAGDLYVLTGPPARAVEIYSGAVP
jgi:hypothetical protein